MYDGTLNYPKTESPQNISPISRYAYQKLLCEQYVLDSNPNSLVLRLPKVYNYNYRGNLLTDSIMPMNNKKMFSWLKTNYFLPFHVIAWQASC